VRPVEGLLFEVEEAEETSYTYILLHDDDDTVNVQTNTEPFELTLGFANDTSLTFHTLHSTYHTNRPKTTHENPEQTAARWKVAKHDSYTRSFFRKTEPMRFAVMKAWIYDDDDWGPRQIADDLARMNLTFEEKNNFANALDAHIAELVLPNVTRTPNKVKAARNYRYMSIGTTRRLQSRTKTRMVTGLRLKD